MFKYEHPISVKKHPSHEPCSHAKNERPRVGSYLSGLWVSTGCDATSSPRPGREGSMFGSETIVRPDTGVKLADNDVYCELSMKVLSTMNFGGA
jgi:hypothetical protein